MPYTPYAYVAPPVGGRLGASIADLIRAKGDIQAQRALNSGALWSNAISGVGQAIGQYQQQKEEKKQRELDEQAVANYFSDPEVFSNPQKAVMGAVKIWGADGLKIAKSLSDINGLSNARDPETAMKALPGVAYAFVKSGPQNRAMSYGMLRNSLIAAQVATPDQLPEQWSEEMLPEVLPLAEAYQPTQKTAEGPKEGSAAWLMQQPPEVRQQYLSTEADLAAAKRAPTEAPKTLAEIEAEAAARARGTASVKPQVEPFDALAQFGDSVGTTASGQKYIDSSVATTKEQKDALKPWAKSVGVKVLDKEQAQSLQEVENATSDLMAGVQSVSDDFPDTVAGVWANTGTAMAQLGDAGARMSAYKRTKADYATRLARATSGGKGLRFSNDLLKRIEASVPDPTIDTRTTAKRKLENLKAYLKNVEDAALNAKPGTVLDVNILDKKPSGSTSTESSGGTDQEPPDA